MKKLLFITAISFLAFACGRNDVDVTPQETCIDTGTGSCLYTTCSNGVSTYYKWNGKKYTCSSTDCSAAAQALVDDQLAAGC